MVDENNNPLVGDNILWALSNPAPEQTTGRTATELGAPTDPGRPSDKKAEPGGKTWSGLIIAVLIAGGVTALILLLHGGDKKPATVSTAPAPHTDTPTGTVLAPGTPGVTAPH